MEEGKVVSLTSRVSKAKSIRVKPTTKQILTLKYINEGLNKRQAQIKAGYSVKNATHNTGRTLRSKSIKQVLDNMKGELVDAGLTTTYMVNKFKEWLEAQKIHGSMTEHDREVPDYKIQLDAYKAWKEIMQPDDGPVGAVKRKLTIEEYFLGPNGEDETTDQ